MKTKKPIAFYLLSFISLVLILLTNKSFHDDGTELLDKIIISTIIFNLLLSFFSFENKILIYIVALQFLYTIFTVSYNDEMDSYFYRISYVFSIGKIHNNSLSAMIQNIWFISFLLSIILEIIFLIKTVYRKIVNKH
ncbi:hypothetical protein [Chryseobacterium paludis]|uniref:hypothetical protein n=1 Tax=Chryseobacterium paludis TaxID=2956784 RepID=UPI0021C0AB00|nr:hypothetical protein [Chryseobacterium paludis]